MNEEHKFYCENCGNQSPLIEEQDHYYVDNFGGIFCSQYCFEDFPYECDWSPIKKVKFKKQDYIPMV